MHFPLLALDYNICNFCFCLCFGGFLFAVLRHICTSSWSILQIHFKFKPWIYSGTFLWMVLSNLILRWDFKIIYVNFIGFPRCPLILVLFSLSAFFIGWRRVVFCSMLVSFWVWSRELLSRECTPGVDQVRCWSTSAAHLAHLSGSVQRWAEHCLWGFSL